MKNFKIAIFSLIAFVLIMPNVFCCIVAHEIHSFQHSQDDVNHHSCESEIKCDAQKHSHLKSANNTYCFDSESHSCDEHEHKDILEHYESGAGLKIELQKRVDVLLGHYLALLIEVFHPKTIDSKRQDFYKTCQDKPDCVYLKSIQNIVVLTI